MAADGQTARHCKQEVEDGEKERERDSKRGRERGDTLCMLRA